VAFIPFESLRDLDAGGWFAPDFAGEPLPTLEETLHLLAGKLRINIEVKEARAGMAVVNLLSHFPGADVVVSSFDHDLLDDLRRAAPELPLAVLFDGVNWRRALARAVSLRARAVHPRADLVSRPLVAACHRQQLQVHVWTVDAPAQARFLARMGVDGLFTNDPAALR
jgi:glycerophosphoryl diester phosphodiesterase